ncbi:BON domain-containing protein [Mariniblastus fucicola]|uniref:BON domain protein n=2 Tax=Mariniblastus fucicola TaxID=980251 RepID=A0A5B9P4G4_9BACT|nr:BON domain-containing protein [Mariniblastus fucicola]QEG20409.1 hypothetical protein MFFC18_02570 [Mariniblastus fucicola]
MPVQSPDSHHHFETGIRDSEPRNKFDFERRERDDELVARSQELLDGHPHFRCRYYQLEFRTQPGRLTISGRLPSFYLKQLAQELLRSLNIEIVNEIEVVDLEDSRSSKQPAG